MSALLPLHRPLEAGIAAALEPIPAVLGSLPGDLLVLLAFALLVAGVAGSVLPVVPSGLLSLSGVVLYWWHTGEPGLLLFTGLVFVAVLLTAVDWLSGAISAKAGGAEMKTVIAATLVGFVGLAIGGPVGFLVGTAGTVFVLELVESEDAVGSARAAGVTLVGMLTSNVLQLLLSGGILAAVLLIFLL